MQCKGEGKTRLVNTASCIRNLTMSIAKNILMECGNARAAAAEALAAVEAVENEIQSLDQWAISHRHEYSEAYMEGWYTAVGYDGKTKLLAARRAAYEKARAAAAAATARWLAYVDAARLSSHEISRLAAAI